MLWKRALMVLGAIWLMGCGAGPEKEPSAPAIAVTAVPVTTEKWPSLYETTGTVRSRTTASLSSKLMGYVREVRAQVGDHVRGGQLLAVLDERETDAGTRRAQAGSAEIRAAIPEADSGVAAAKAGLDLSRVTFTRMQDLYRQKSISDQEMDEASAKLKAAEAGFEIARAKRTQLDFRLAQTEQDVQSAEIMRGYDQIAAPFAGLIVARSVEPGAIVIPGAPLFTLERDGALRLEAQVEESRLAAIGIGEPVTVSLDGIDRKMNLRVSEVVPAVDATSRAYTVKIDLPATPSLRSGVFGRAEFRLGSRVLLTAPNGAVVERGQLQSLFVADHHAARLRLITTGQKAGDRVEVLSGLAASERVIYPIPVNLADGSAIEVRP